MTPRLSIVLPAYCEAGSLDRIIDRVRAVADPLGAAEYIIVDDGSTDETWAAIERLASKIINVRGIRLSRNFGKEGAVAAGLEAARGEAVIVMDADLQHPPELIPEMVRLWEGGAEIVNAVKRGRQNESFVKAWLTRGYFSLFATLAGMDVGNAADFKLLNRRVVDCLQSLPERERYFRGLVAWVGFRQETLSFDVAQRESGQSKWSGAKLFGLALNSVASFSTLPMHLMTLLGLGFAILATLLTARTIWLWSTGAAIPGFTTVILLLIVIGAIVMLGLGVIGVYIAKIYEEVKKRPGFIVQETVSAEALETLDNDKDQTAQSNVQGKTGKRSRQADLS